MKGEGLVGQDHLQPLTPAINSFKYQGLSTSLLTKPISKAVVSVSVACYARAQGYEFRIIISTDFTKQCKHKDVSQLPYRCTGFTAIHSHLGLSSAALCGG